jgi:hypothetical protein
LRRSLFILKDIQNMLSNKLSLTIRAVLTLGLMGSASIANAQYTSTDLTQNGNPTTILAVSANGTLVGVSTASDPSGLTVGTESWFVTGANASNPTTFASAVIGADFCGNFVYSSGTLPGGLPLSQGSQVGIEAVNNSGQMIVTGGFGGGSSVVNANGTVISFGTEQPEKISNSGAVAGIITGNNGGGQSSILGYAAPGASSMTAIALPTAATSEPFNAIAGISATRSIVAGNASFDPFEDHQIFVTGANGHGVTLLGVGNGVGVLPNNSLNSVVAPGTNITAWATSVNDSGQVGGSYTVLNRQQFIPFQGLTDFTTEQAFITSGTSFIDISPDSIDNYQTDFLNDANQAIVQDMNTGAYYFYSGGTDYALSSLFSGSISWGSVIGLTSNGSIVINDPQILELDPTIRLTGGIDTTTNPDALIEASKPGNAPADSSVPEPGTMGLFGLGIFALGAGLFGRKRQSAVLG